MVRNTHHKRASGGHCSKSRLSPLVLCTLSKYDPEVTNTGGYGFVLAVGINVKP